MKSKSLGLRLNPAIYGLILSSVLFFTSCEEKVQLFELKADIEETQEYKIVSLMREAISGSSSVSTKSLTDDDNKQCVEFEYPIIFYAQLPGALTIDLITIENDQDLIDFFDGINSLEEVRIDYPLVLFDDDGNRTIVYNNEEMEGTLQAAVDACRGDGDYEYCDNKNKKVYICHNGHTICVSVNAIWGHINNHEGDVLGQCKDDNDGN
jgi:hypothetical protein